MPKVSAIQTSFNVGEISPLLYGRVDLDAYTNALAICLNCIPTVEGPITRRPGTYYAAEVKTSAKETRVVPFRFSTTQAYIIEFGDLYIRFFKNNGAVMDGGDPYEIVTPYTEADLFQLKFTQSADVLYIDHPNYAPRKLSRETDTDWSLDTIVFLDGPYGDINTSLATRLQSDPVSGESVTLKVLAGGTAITNATNASGLIRITAASHGVITGQTVVISDVLGTAEANGVWTVTRIDANQIDLQGSAFSVAYISGGAIGSKISGAADNGSGLIRITTLGHHWILTGDQILISEVVGTTEANTSWIATKISNTVMDLQASTFSNAYVSGGIISPAVFLSTDIGRLIRLKHGSTWGYAKIVSYDSIIQVKIDIISSFGLPVPTLDWRLGLWSDRTGYPAVPIFHENRLVHGGNTSAQQRLDASRTGDYENMAPTDIDGTVADSHAYSFTLNSEDVQVIRWMKNDEKALFVGTAEGEWPVRPSSDGEALSPTNVNAKQSTSYGSADVNAVKAGKSVLYVQKSARKLRRMTYDWEVDGFSAPNVTRLAEHITKGPTVAESGIKELAWQQDPQPYIWAVRNDGVLLSLLYEDDEKVMGWSRHILGGVSNSSGAAPVIESIAVIPAADGSRDELWMVVKRYINGSTVRYIEYMTKMWERGDTPAAGIFGDCALSYVGSAVSTITGLTHLKGETVSVLIDGAAHLDVVVNASGEISLSQSASEVQVGYKYNSDGRMLRQDVGAADGTSQGKNQRAHKVIFRFHDTGPVKVGESFNTTGLGKLTVIPFRVSTDDTDTPVPLFSGDKVLDWESDYKLDTYFCWRWDSMLPGTILAVMPVIYTQDR